MNDIVIAITDRTAGVKVICEAWEGSVHLSFTESQIDGQPAAPDLTPDGARALAAVLTFAASTQDGAA